MSCSRPTEPVEAVGMFRSSINLKHTSVCPECFLICPPVASGPLVDLCFVSQPEGSFSLTVTWTPSEEGGIRELIVFNANGVLKHQVVMLGRAEAPKKKKVNILSLMQKLLQLQCDEMDLDS